MQELAGCDYFRTSQDFHLADIYRIVGGIWGLARQNRVQIYPSVFTLSEKQHPDKTLISRTERGFDFLGYRFEPGSLSVADQTIERFQEHIVRLYEQGADPGCIGQYGRRWIQWVRGGVRLRVDGFLKNQPCQRIASP